MDRLNFRRIKCEKDVYEVVTERESRDFHYSRLPRMDYAQLLPYLPVSLVFIIPVLFGVYQLIFTSLRSPIHFQQGLHDAKSWRGALCGALLAVSPFVCVLPLSSGRRFYYTSPCNISSADDRFCAWSSRIAFHNVTSKVRLSVVLVHVLLIAALSVMLLVYSTSFLVQIISFSPPVVCAAIAYLGVFSVLCGGQTTVSSPTLFLPFFVIVAGFGVLTYKGVTELENTLERVDMIESISSAPTWIAFSLGVLNGLHLGIASPLLYQQYFSLNTRQRLRNSLILHVIFFTLFSVSLLSTSSLYTSFLASECPPFASFSSIVAFLGTVLPSSEIVTNFLAISCILITTVSFSFTLISLSTLIWEDIARPRFERCSQIRQLYIVQVCGCFVGLIGAGTVVTACSIALIHYGEDFLAYAPFAFLSISVLASPITALFLCSLVFPFTNSKGAMGGLLIGYLAIGILSLIHFRASVVLFSLSPCLNATSDAMSLHDVTPVSVGNSTLLSISLLSTPTTYEQSSAILHFLETVPFSMFPLVAFLISCLTTIGISVCCGGEDMVALDWNLIACPSIAHVLLRHGTITARSRRAFIESESFRYAQQTPYPDTKYLTAKMDRFQERQKLT
ncbi:unnamed protein product [Toxocara canis]|uniref:Sodium-coupled monocarboxylate transporter 1 n=1 Tax=Toxocara canis TaxID=6265 RepID=A0A183UBX0_TOXCA|nr:unnamed protein product [Toxocara canis]